MSVWRLLSLVCLAGCSFTVTFDPDIDKNDGPIPFPAGGTDGATYTQPGAECIGPDDSDGDGIPDDEDDCPGDENGNGIPDDQETATNTDPVDTTGTTTEPVPTGTTGTTGTETVEDTGSSCGTWVSPNGGFDEDGDGVLDDCGIGNIVHDGSSDTDLDGIPDTEDPDTDGDGVLDEDDADVCDPNCQ